LNKKEKEPKVNNNEDITTDDINKINKQDIDFTIDFE
jgi:hypothetical protein